MKIKILSILALLLTMTQGVWADDKTEYGVLNGEFSVSADKKVHFSRGNLRAYYHLAEVWAWSFADNQYDYVGKADGNTLISGNGKLSSTNHYVDLFCWSTNATYFGIHNSTENSTYSGSFKDWGTNAISNGGDKANIWYTPSDDEWTYLMYTRATTTTNMPTGTNSSAARYTMATVANKAGLILFPDNYVHPNDANVTVNNAAYNNVYYIDNSGFGTFTVNAENWAKMEAAGAVFLPTAGWRSGNDGGGAGDRGRYWLATSIDTYSASSIFFGTASGTAANDYYLRFGRSVRLVIESHTITYNANGGEGSVDVLPKYTGLDRTLSDGTGLTRSGYILDGWATTADGAKVYDLGATYTADADVTLYAHWTQNTATLTDGEAITALNTYTGQEIWVNYTRSFTADKASTVCLPFAYTKKTGDGSFYAFSGIEKVGSEYIATMTEPGTSTLTANTPYLYKAETTGVTDFSGRYAIPASIEAGTTTSGNWTFKGTYSTINWTDAPTTPTYGFSAQDTNDDITQGQFVKVGSYVRIKPMRAYLEYSGTDSQFANARSLTRAAATTSDDTLPETIGVRLISANGEVTAIGTLYTRTGEVSFDSEAWYTLDGKRLNAKPNTKGIYVNNGKKVVIK